MELHTAHVLWGARLAGIHVWVATYAKNQTTELVARGGGAVAEQLKINTKVVAGARTLGARAVKLEEAAQMGLQRGVVGKEGGAEEEAEEEGVVKVESELSVA